MQTWTTCVTNGLEWKLIWKLFGAVWPNSAAFQPVL
jgi:hypothetical protein